MTVRWSRVADRPDIVLVSDEEDPQLRWSFTEITPDSFTWRGETSLDGGETWTLDEVMLARRAGGRLPSSVDQGESP